MAAHIGLDPANDIHWVTSQSPRPDELFADGKIDACLGLPPVPQDLRARHVGHVVVNSSMDQPWSQYFCCMLAGHRDYVQKYPVATKRVLRAILKATDFCASEPERAARRLVDGGFTARYDYALQTLRDVPYDKWREYEPEDTLRYYALRLHELGFVIHPTEDHRRRHGLALRQRAQTRAEGVKGRGTMTYTRRRILTTLSLAGGANLICAPRVLAAEAELETTSVRLLKNPAICMAPLYVADELLRT